LNIVCDQSNTICFYRRNKSTGALPGYDGLPESLKKECLVRATEDEEDEEELKVRQELIKTNTPAQLAKIGGVGDFASLLRPAQKRTLKSTKDKELNKKRSKSWSSLPDQSRLRSAVPASLQKECLVRTKEEDDPEKLKARQELVKSATPAQLSQISGLGDFPVPKLFSKKKDKDKDDKASRFVHCPMF
jgi:myosin heavy subunit